MAKEFFCLLVGIISITTGGILNYATWLKQHGDTTSAAMAVPVLTAGVAVAVFHLLLARLWWWDDRQVPSPVFRRILSFLLATASMLVASVVYAATGNELFYLVALAVMVAAILVIRGVLRESTPVTLQFPLASADE